ncbi:3814_t:CDS:2, partial [Acaulospora morrowiae]
QENTENIVSIRLPHPRTGLPARYIIQEGELLEVQRVDCGSRKSWFIEDTVHKDGSFLFFTRIDPLFLMLPILDVCRRKNSESQGFFHTLEDMLFNQDFPSMTRLSSVNNISTYLEWICDSQDLNQENKVYRLNDDKLMNWLKTKVTNILSNFDEHKALKQLSEQLDNSTVDDRHIQEVIMEYLPNYWTEQLKKEYTFDELGKWSSQGIVYMTEVSSVYRENRQQIEKEIKQSVKKRKLTHGQSSLAKANKTGMKKMTSFFTKVSESQ